MPDAPSYVIVGAAGGVGAALCRRLSAAGANLFLCGRDAGKLERLANELPGPCTIHPLDAAKPGAAEAAFEVAAGVYGRVDGAANLAGSILLKPLHLTTDAEFEETLTQNLRTAFAVTRAACRAMLPTGGSVVLVSTVATKVGLVNHEAIAAAKGGVNGLVLAAAATYAPRGIRVNAVAPGLVDTPLAAKITGNELAKKASVAMHPLGRIGAPDDVAAAAAYLLGPESGWVTGQVLGVDGGLGSVRGR